jgi:hypothetical protein
MYGAVGDAFYNTWLCMTEVTGDPQLWSVPSTGAGQSARASNCRGLTAFAGSLYFSTQFISGIDDDFVCFVRGMPISRRITSATPVRITHAFLFSMQYLGLAVLGNAVTGSSEVWVASLSAGLLRFTYGAVPGSIPSPAALDADYSVWVPGCAAGYSCCPPPRCPQSPA